jgi:hypothetical protein
MKIVCGVLGYFAVTYVGSFSGISREKMEFESIAHADFGDY